MNRSNGLVLLMALFATALSSCELIGDIFEFGMWVGIIIVVVIVLVVIWLLRMIF